MRSLIVKIFLCYWIGASLVVLVLDLNPHEQMHRPEVTAALASALRIHGRALAQTYEAGGCGAAASLMSDPEDAMDLASPDGHVLCDPPARPRTESVDRFGRSFQETDRQ